MTVTEAENLRCLGLCLYLFKADTADALETLLQVNEIYLMTKSIASQNVGGYLNLNKSVVSKQ
jgi:hypothetical protein